METQQFAKSVDQLPAHHPPTGTIPTPHHSRSSPEHTQGIPADRIDELQVSGRQLVADELETRASEDLQELRTQFTLLSYQKFESHRLRIIVVEGQQPLGSDTRFCLADGDPYNMQFETCLNQLRSLVTDLVRLHSSCATRSLLPRIDGVKAEVEGAVAAMDKLLLDAINKEKASLDAYTRQVPGVQRVDPHVIGIGHRQPLNVVFMLLAAVIHHVLGVSSAATRLILECVRCIVLLAFVTALEAQAPSASIPPALQDIMKHLPIDPETAAKHLRLYSHYTDYACCPKCCAIYPPLDPQAPTPYQVLCTRTRNGRVCEERLLRSRIVGGTTHWYPIRRFPFRNPSSFVGELLSRPGVEDAITNHIPMPRDICTDIWDAEFLGNAKGPDNLAFFNGTIRLAFALAIDWFNPFSNMEAKKKWSIGAIYLVCLNLPLSMRFKLENVCLVGIIPGPREPSQEEINEFINPVVDAFLSMWDPGLWISRTALHSTGCLARVMLALIIADLLGSRQITGFTFPSHTLFCSYCLLTRNNIDNLDRSQWPRRTLRKHREAVAAWEGALTIQDKESVTTSSGIRGSSLNRLPYWNPFEQTVIDILHLWLAILAKHGRDAWHMSITLEEGDGTYDPLYEPPDASIMALAEKALMEETKTSLKRLVGKKAMVELCLRRNIRTGGRTKKQLLEDLTKWRVENHITNASGQQVNQQPNPSTLVNPPPQVEILNGAAQIPDPAQLASALHLLINGGSNQRSLNQRLKKPVVQTICGHLGVNENGKKAELIERLLNVDPTSLQALLYTTEHQAIYSSPSSPRFVPVLGQALLLRVRKDINLTIVPSWFKAAPTNLGDPKHGKLSAKEWRSTFTVAFLITLPKTWGLEYRQNPQTGMAKVLDNFIHLVLAVLLSTQETTTNTLIQLYDIHIQEYLKGFKLLYPTQTITPYMHLSLHLPDLMRLMGPWISWGTGPYEMFNGMAQKVPTNSRFGDLEVSIARAFSATSQINGIIEGDYLPSEGQGVGKLVQQFMSSSRLGGLGRNTSIDFQNRGTWEAIGPLHPTLVPPDIHKALCEAYPGSPPAKQLAQCEVITHSGMRFSVGKRSAHDSHVCYQSTAGQATELRFGQIHSILVETCPSGTNRIFVVIQRYQPLSTIDEEKDIYGNHPLIGKKGYNLCRIVYDSLLNSWDMVEANALLGHIARFVPVDRNFIAKTVEDNLLEKMKGMYDHAGTTGRNVKRRNDQDSTSTAAKRSRI
ncbi:hypothetical protein FRB99_002432 [Tulasnella sp. 403]|nr:hypothetical protein FRB99_002432 [Tulasnella sp. 403]